MAGAVAIGLMLVIVFYTFSVRHKRNVVGRNFHTSGQSTAFNFFSDQTNAEELAKFVRVLEYRFPCYTKLIENGRKNFATRTKQIRRSNLIFLLWQHFEHSMREESDKIHLGLHEFAHAMMNEFDNFNYLPQWKNWLSIAQPILLEVRQADIHLFREYGGTNIQEFWAVTFETFFEQPFEFRSNHFALYIATAAMLNQDPCARHEIFESM